MLGKNNIYSREKRRRERLSGFWLFHDSMKQKAGEYLGLSNLRDTGEQTNSLVQSVIFITVYLFFASKHLVEILQLTPLHFIFLGAGLTILLEPIFALVEWIRAKNKNASMLSKVLVGIALAIIINVAVWGVTLAAATFALVTPILFTVGTGLLAVYEAGLFSINLTKFIANTWRHWQSNSPHNASRKQLAFGMLEHGMKAAVFGVLSATTAIFMIMHITSIPLVVLSEIFLVTPVVVTYGLKLINLLRGSRPQIEQQKKLNSRLRKDAVQHANKKRFIIAEPGKKFTLKVNTPRVNDKPTYLQSLSADHCHDTRKTTRWSYYLPHDRAAYVEGLARNTVGDLTYSGLLASKEYLLLQIDDKLGQLVTKQRRLMDASGVFLKVQRYVELEKIEAKIHMLNGLIELIGGKETKLPPKNAMTKVDHIDEFIRKVPVVNIPYGFVAPLSKDARAERSKKVPSKKSTPYIEYLERKSNSTGIFPSKANQSFFKNEGDVENLVRAAKVLVAMIHEAYDEGLDLNAQKEENHALIVGELRQGFKHAIARAAA